MINAKFSLQPKDHDRQPNASPARETSANGFWHSVKLKDVTKRQRLLQEAARRGGDASATEADTQTEPTSTQRSESGSSSAQPTTPIQAQLLGVS